MFTESSLNVHWMFTERSLNVHWMLTECCPMFTTGESQPNILIYMSCGIQALKKDTAVLVKTGGWHVAHAGMVNPKP
jgi:hypothetical protein